MAYLYLNYIINSLTVIFLFQSVVCRPLIDSDQILTKLLSSMSTLEQDLQTKRTGSTGRTSRRTDFLAHDQPTKKANSVDDTGSIYDAFLLNGVKPGTAIQPDYIPNVKPSGTFPYSLICKNGYLLAINKDGKVKGTLQRNSSTVFNFEVYGKGLVTIWSTDSQRYLAMDSNGHLKTVKNRTIETFFTHRVLPNLYRTFQSLYHRQNGWHIGIRKNGHLKRGRPSNGKTQTAYQFIIMNFK